MKNLYQKICQFDLSAIIRRHYQKTDGVFWCAFFAAFIALNLIFLYHGVQFLFGDHDWRYLKNGIPLGAGLFEGRFAQFLAINILSRGEILPIINNVLGFAGFSLGIALLARYWQLPHNRQSYILFALFAAITPYILAFMYFAFLIIPVLSWNAVIIGALIISEKEKTFSLTKSFAAILLITLALGGYPPVINLIGVALITRWLIATLYEKKDIKKLIKDYRWSIINIIIAGVLYKLILILLSATKQLNPNYYNLQTVPISQWGDHFLLILKDFFLQFSATLPFITAPYKCALIIMTIIGLTVIWQSKKRLLSLLLFFGIFLAGLSTLFLSTSIKETEFSPRIDFFGFMYGITAMYALISHTKIQSLKNLANIVAISSIFISTHALFEAQKVWHLGFINEMLLYKRVLKRFEQSPLFNSYNRYIVVQGGSPAFRERYYHDAYQYQSDDLLKVSYVPSMASGVMWNYYAPHDYIDQTSYVYTFTAKDDFKEALRTTDFWPHANSVKVGGYWILLTFNETGLNNLRKRYLENQQ